MRQGTPIAIRDLDLLCNGQPVLRAINLDVPAQRVVGLIGPARAGKSALLRVLNRMIDLDPRQHAAGAVWLDGENILAPGTDVRALRRRVGLVLPEPTPFPMSIQDNIGFGVALHERLGRAEMQARLEWSLGQVGLWDEVKDRLRRPAWQLDAGQRQLLCIARCIATRPDIILLDEPARVLDAAAGSRIESVVETLKRDFTILIATRNRQLAARCADIVAFLHAGVLVESNETARIFTAPQLALTQTYLAGRLG